MPETKYAIRDTRDGRLIGLDEASGGYPWKPTHPSSVKLWPMKREAINYCEVMGWRSHSDTYGALSWEVVEVEPLVVREKHIDYAAYNALSKSLSFP